jgi:hypothetical protein
MALYTCDSTIRFRGMRWDDSTFFFSLESAGSGRTQWLSRANTILDIQAVAKAANFFTGSVTSSFLIRTCPTALRPSLTELLICRSVGPHLTMGRQKHNTSETSKSCQNVTWIIYCKALINAQDCRFLFALQCNKGIRSSVLCCCETTIMLMIG